MFFYCFLFKLIQTFDIAFQCIVPFSKPFTLDTLLYQVKVFTVHNQICLNWVSHSIWNTGDETKNKTNNKKKKIKSNTNESEWNFAFAMLNKTFEMWRQMIYFDRYDCHESNEQTNKQTSDFNRFVSFKYIFKQMRSEIIGTFHSPLDLYLAGKKVQYLSRPIQTTIDR